MIDKIQNFILTPIKVSYKERSDYSPIENFILNPLVLALLVFLVTFQAFSLSGEAKPTQSDTALSNAMIYFEKGDFEVSEDFYDKVLSIPIYPLLEDDQVEEVAIKIKSLLQSKII